eukprot:1998338-Rhodomonas_salina.3
MVPALARYPRLFALEAQPHDLRALGQYRTPRSSAVAPYRRPTVGRSTQASPSRSAAADPFARSWYQHALGHYAVAHIQLSARQRVYPHALGQVAVADTGQRVGPSQDTLGQYWTAGSKRIGA